MTPAGQKSTLTEFLLARIAEEEAAPDCPGSGEYFGCWEWSGHHVAETQAKRRIVARVAEIDAEYARAEESDGMVGTWAVEESVGLDFAVRQLAAVYADHLDYQDEWRP